MIRQAQYFPAGEDAGSLRLLSFIRFSAEDISMQDKTTASNNPCNTIPCLSEKGSVMAEYILLTALIWLPLLGFFSMPHSFVNGDFGRLGNAILTRYHQMLYIVSLPFP